MTAIAPWLSTCMLESPNKVTESFGAPESLFFSNAATLQVHETRP